MYTFLYRHLRSEEVGEMLHIFQGDVYLSWRLEEKHCTYIWGKGEAEWVTLSNGMKQKDYYCTEVERGCNSLWIEYWLQNTL